MNPKGLYLTSEKEKDNQSFMSYLCNDGKVQKCVISRAVQSYCFANLRVIALLT